MLRVFASSLAANIAFVLSALLKQYLLAGALSVVDFGTYGSMVALTSLLLVLVPFPAYLNVLINGFSASAGAFGTRKRLVLAARLEIILLACLVLVTSTMLGIYGMLVSTPDPRTWALPLLLLAQYMITCLDILLRMQQAHRRIAFFMTVRNVPAIILLITIAPSSPLYVVLIDFITAILVSGYFLQSPPLRIKKKLNFLKYGWRFTREQIVLWLARLTQFGNSSLLRVLIPLLYSAHDTGLFFFALIAQLPCSLFLSVTTQLYGHTLARLQIGDWSKLLQTQASFIFPNLLYAAIAGVALQYWEPIITHIPKLAKYAEADPLIFSIIVYGAVLSSDCQEYLLRSRGFSNILLKFSTTSVAGQIACIVISSQYNINLEKTIYMCAAVQAFMLAGSSIYSFRKVLGATILEPIS